MLSKLKGNLVVITEVSLDIGRQQFIFLSKLAVNVSLNWKKLV